MSRIQVTVSMQATISYRKLVTVLHNAHKADMIDGLHKLVTATPLPTWTCNKSENYKLVRYGSYLKERYLAEIGTYTFDWPPNVTDKIFNLAMIKKERVNLGEIDDEYVRLTITGKVDDILFKKAPIELKDILHTIENKRKVVLLEGAPGSGKSTLTLHICQKWGKDELFQEYPVVIIVQLRDPAVRNAQSIADLLPCRDAAMAEEIAAEITVRDGDGVLWILDGWDELPTNPRRLSVFKDLITLPTKSPICKSTIIVTSRPISSTFLHRYVSSRIEILGFTANELRRYFEECLNEESPTVVEALFDKISEYPALKCSCHLPLNAAVVAHVYRCSNYSLPNTQYKMFLTIILNFIYRHIQKEGYHDDCLSLESFEDLPDDLTSHFEAICRLAYDGIMENKVAFRSKDLPRSFNTLGLLQAVESFGVVGKCISYHFLHLSFQELLAAYFIATHLPEEEQVIKFEELYSKPHFAAVFQYYAAITKLTKPGFPKVISCVLISHGWWSKDLVPLLRCIYEVQDPDLCIFVAEKLPLQKLSLSLVSLTPTDCLCIGYFMACVCSSTTDSFEVDLSSAFVGDYGCKYLLKCLNTATASVMTTKLELSLPSNQLTEDGIQSLTQFLQSSGCRALQRLTLGYKKPGVAIYTDKLSTEVDLISPLSKSLETNHILTELSLIKCNLSITDANGPALVTMLQLNRSLQVLELENNPNIGDQGALHIAEGLKINSTLKELNLNKCGLTYKSMTQLAEALTLNTTLKNLDVGENNISDAGVIFLAKALNSNTGLTDLNLVGCNMSDMSLNELGACLTVNRSLKVVRLGHQQQCIQEEIPKAITDRGLMQLADHLTGGSSTLETLEITPTLLTNSLFINKAIEKLKLRKVCVKLYDPKLVNDYLTCNPILVSHWDNLTPTLTMQRPLHSPIARSKTKMCGIM